MPPRPKGEKRPADIDHAQLVKQYGATYDSVKRRYSPPKASGMTQFDSDEEFLNAIRSLIYHLCDERQLRPLGLLLPSYLAFNGTADGWVELRVGLVNLRDLFGSESFVPLDWDVLNDLIHAAETAIQNSN